MSGPKLLVLSASTGNGHLSAAEAIVAEAKSRGLAARHVDTLDFTPKGFQTWYRGGYETLVRRRPAAWGHLYRTSDRPLFNYWFQTRLDAAMCRGIRRLLQAENPDWVVCTHSLPQPTLATLRRQFSYRTAIVVTDLYPHRMWLRGRPDWYFVPQEYSRTILERRIPWSKGHITVSGMPISSLFKRKSSPADGKVTALMTSGGIGGGPLIEAARAVAEAGVHLIIVAGRNAALRDGLQAAFSQSPEVEVFGHVDQATMAGLMERSHMLVAKPGGLTTFEALAMELPFIVYKPFLIPGQEEGNADFLVQSGAGVSVGNAEELGSAVSRLAADPAKRQQMAADAKSQSMPDATKTIVDELIRLHGIRLGQ
ncbi:MAG: glycosyltransferase [Armatimonadetes bacterium]|nr:glycosyltransferase [Armatimonadota bacterium]